MLCEKKENILYLCLDVYVKATSKLVAQEWQQNCSQSFPASLTVVSANSHSLLTFIMG